LGESQLRIKEIKGQRFGELLVLDDFSKVLAKRSRRFLKCKCSCGNIAFVEKSKVLRGHTLSCGHLQRKMRKNLGELKKLPYGEACENETYKCYQKNALKRGYEFTLSKEEFRNIITQPCFYCGKLRLVEKLLARTTNFSTVSVRTANPANIACINTQSHFNHLI
jgi:hypothetical protein